MLLLNNAQHVIKHVLHAMVLQQINVIPVLKDSSQKDTHVKINALMENSEMFKLENVNSVPDNVKPVKVLLLMIV